jgi:hypothetical protein
MFGKHAQVAFPRNEHMSKDILNLGIKYEEQGALKVEPISLVISRVVQQPLGGEELTISHSTSVRRSRWFTQTLRDAREYIEICRCTFRER